MTVLLLSEEREAGSCLQSHYACSQLPSPRPLPSVGAREIFGEAGETEPTVGSVTDDVTGMEAEEAATAEPMGGSGQDAEMGAGAADLGERGGYIRPTGRKGGAAQWLLLVSKQ